jgi:hypothetical protein
VPFSGLAEFGPPSALVILHHQPLALRLELLIVDGPGVVLPLEFGVAAVGFLEIYLVISKIHRALVYLFTPVLSFRLFQMAGSDFVCC